MRGMFILCIISCIFSPDILFRRVKVADLISGYLPRIVIEPSEVIKARLPDLGGEDFLRFLNEEISYLEKSLVKKIGIEKIYKT